MMTTHQTSFDFKSRLHHHLNPIQTRSVPDLNFMIRDQNPSDPSSSPPIDHRRYGFVFDGEVSDQDLSSSNTVKKHWLRGQASVSVFLFILSNLNLGVTEFKNHRFKLRFSSFSSFKRTVGGHHPTYRMKGKKNTLHLPHPVKVVVYHHHQIY